MSYFVSQRGLLCHTDIDWNKHICDILSERGLLCHTDTANQQVAIINGRFP